MGLHDQTLSITTGVCECCKIPLTCCSNRRLPRTLYLTIHVDTPLDGDTTCDLTDTPITLTWVAGGGANYWSSGSLTIFGGPGTIEFRLYRCNDARTGAPADTFAMLSIGGGCKADNFGTFVTDSCDPLHLTQVLSENYPGGQPFCPCHTLFSPAPTLGAFYQITYTVTE